METIPEFPHSQRKDLYHVKKGLGWHIADSHDQLNHETRTALEEHQHTHALHRPTFNNQVEIKEKDFMPLVANRNDLDHLFGQVHAGDFSNIEEGTSLFEKTMDLYARNNAFHES